MNKKHLKNPSTIIAVCLFILCNICGVLGFYLIDRDTGFRAEAWDNNWYSELIRNMGIIRLDISFVMGFVWFIAYLGLLVLAAAIIFRRQAEALAARRGIGKKKFDIIYFTAAAAITVICFVISFVVFQLKFGGAKYVILMFGYYFLPIVMLLLVVMLIYFIVMIIITVVKSQITDKAAKQTITASGKTVSDDEDGVIFPGLLDIDEKYKGVKIKDVAKDPPCSLNELAAGFQSYLAQKCSLYYDLPLIRSFIAGMATSRLIILEGLSGTGKSSLPRYFCEYVGSKAFFAPVQTTWRDRSDILGFYNDFSGVFKEMPFLKKLYEASYTPANFNMMVLDEMNISRVEYYFADFLSIMEYPISDWKVNIISHVPESQQPAKIVDDSVVIPFNTWFVGTANKDDSTFTITDKVYDRAVVLAFSDQNAKIETTAPSDPIEMTPNQLYNMFVNACNESSNRLTSADMVKFTQVTQFIYDTFDIVFGNRIMNQIYIFVPVYVSLGGTKEEALDIMLAGKILHKLDGRFDDYMKDGLLRLQNLINSVYGPGVMSSTTKLIRRLLKKLM